MTKEQKKNAKAMAKLDKVVQAEGPRVYKALTEEERLDAARCASCCTVLAICFTHPLRRTQIQFLRTAACLYSLPFLEGILQMLGQSLATKAKQEGPVIVQLMPSGDEAMISICLSSMALNSWRQ